MNTEKQAIGFVSAPDWLDPAPAEFMDLADGAVTVQQTFLGAPGFDYRTDSIAATEPDITLACRHLAAAGCTLIASPATPFGFIGHNDIGDARARMTRISSTCGAECISSVTAIFDVLDQWQIGKVALACTYYPDDWRDIWASFVSRSGIAVAAAASLVNLGIRPKPDPSEFVVYPDASEISAAVEKMAADYPDADAIVVTGSGARTVALTGQLLSLAGKPVLAADTALFSVLAQKAGVPIPLTL